MQNDSFPATLALEDGTILHGKAFGSATDAVFELVFNTAMTGYQEILTDPSYRGQGVLFTTPHIGNVGANLEDDESSVPQVSAALVRAISPLVSSWRAEIDLSSWLSRHGVPGISEIDTRWLTRRIRERGVMKAALSTRRTSPERLLGMARDWPGLDGRDMVQEVTCHAAYPWLGDSGERWAREQNSPHPGSAGHAVLFDFGAKRNIARSLSAQGMRVTIIPADTSCSAVLALQPDGIILSNGPGDPAGLEKISGMVRELIMHDIPIFGICLGHQLIGLAMGGKTIKLKFGHHSANHPVQDLRTGKVQITSQNHNYAVAIESLDPQEVELTHLSLNDRTVEGLRLKRHPVFSVQYHPEASPGPHDASGLFAQFYSMIGEKRHAQA